MSSIRPVGTGGRAEASPFMRTLASPRSGLVFTSSMSVPGDWPEADDASPEANLAHAVGWTCEVRRASLVLLNPLGEGFLRSELPQLSTEWLANVRHDGSCAVYLAPAEADAGFAELTIASAVAGGRLVAATVRCGIADDHGRQEPVGRNQPCPCGSGKKYKHCHG